MQQSPHGDVAKGRAGPGAPHSAAHSTSRINRARRLPLLLLRTDLTWHGTAQHGTARHGTARHGPFRPDPIQYGTAQPGPTRHDQTRPDPTRPGDLPDSVPDATQPDPTRQDLTTHGMACLHDETSYQAWPTKRRASNDQQIKW